MDTVTHCDITCYGCRFRGHYHNQCPYVGQTGVVSVNFGCLLTQAQFVDILKSWVLLDSCSTCDVSNNHNFLSNVKDCNPENRMTAFTNGGEQKYLHFTDMNLLHITVHFVTDLSSRRRPGQTNLNYRRQTHPEPFLCRRRFAR